VAGVYLSYPFCAQKCTYCNFDPGVFPRATEARYREALLAKLGGPTLRLTPRGVMLSNEVFQEFVIP
jgi:oxygen-independent coproporphyrinogen III oxidase